MRRTPLEMKLMYVAWGVILAMVLVLIDPTIVDIFLLEGGACNLKYNDTHIHPLFYDKVVEKDHVCEYMGKKIFALNDEEILCSYGCYDLDNGIEVSAWEVVNTSALEQWKYDIAHPPKPPKEPKSRTYRLIIVFVVMVCWVIIVFIVNHKWRHTRAEELHAWMVSDLDDRIKEKPNLKVEFKLVFSKIPSPSTMSGIRSFFTPFSRYKKEYLDVIEEIEQNKNGRKKQ